MTVPGARLWDAAVGAVRGLRRTAAVEYARASLWLLPSLFVIFFAAAGSFLIQVKVAPGSLLSHLAFPGDAESARGILQVIAGSVITVTGVVFSLTVVTLQLASTQFSPRLLRTFLRDVSNQLVLGTFLATFTYALLVLRAIRSASEEGEGTVPALAVTGAYVLTAASVAAFVFFIDHISRSIRIDSLMRKVNEDTVEAIEDLFDNDDDSLVSPADAPDAAEDAVPIPAPRSGFVQATDAHRLVAVAEAAGVVIRVDPSVGDRVIAGSPLAWVWREGGVARPDDALVAAIEDAVRIGYERTMQQDVAFGFRQLVDVAVKALSPGVNDPTTAVHAIGHLAALLSRLARCNIGYRVCRDSNGRPTVIVPGMDLSGYLDLACGQIRRYGSGEPAVMIALLQMLRDVTRCDLPPDHAEAVEHQAAIIVAAAERSVPERHDLEQVRDAHRRLTGKGPRPGNVPQDA